MQTSRFLSRCILLSAVLAGLHAAASAQPSATGIASSLTTVDELLRRENDAALNKQRTGVQASGSAGNLSEQGKERQQVTRLETTVDAIYGTESLKADLTIAGQPITVTAGSVISNRCRVTAIADRCVLMEPYVATKANAKIKSAKDQAALARNSMCPVRSCWVGTVATIPTTAQATLGLTPPPAAQPRPLTPLPTALGTPKNIQDFPVTVTPSNSLGADEAILRK